MASERQIAANRANAQKSTGPKSSEGKARAAQNARRHGLRSRAPSLLTPEVIALAQRLQADDPALCEDQALGWADALLRKSVIQQLKSELVEQTLPRIDPDLTEEQRREIARMAVLKELYPLSLYEAQAEAAIRGHLKRAASRRRKEA